MNHSFHAISIPHGSASTTALVAYCACGDWIYQAQPICSDHAIEAHACLSEGQASKEQEMWVLAGVFRRHLKERIALVDMAEFMDADA